MDAALARELAHVQGCARVRDAPARGMWKPRLVEHPGLPGPQITPIARLELLDRDALGRIFRVQIEGQPLDLGAVPTLQPRRAFGRDVAKRSYVVGPKTDKEWHMSGLYPIVSLSP